MTASKVPLLLLLGIHIVVGQNFWNKYQQQSVPYFNVQDAWYSSFPDMPRFNNFGTVGIPSQRPGLPYDATSSSNRGLGKSTMPYMSSIMRQPNLNKPSDVMMYGLHDRMDGVLGDYLYNTRIVS